MTIRMTQERREAYVEVLEIIEHMDEKYQKKIPLKLRQYFLENASKKYEFHINPSIPLKEYELKEATINLLAMLNLNYWCEDENHKQELIRQYSENEKKYQKKLRETYNSDNIFKRNIQEQNTQKEILKNEIEIVEYKESVITKIIKKIKNIIKKLKMRDDY